MWDFVSKHSSDYSSIGSPVSVAVDSLPEGAGKLADHYSDNTRVSLNDCLLLVCPLRLRFSPLKGTVCFGSIVAASELSGNIYSKRRIKNSLASICQSLKVNKQSCLHRLLYKSYVQWIKVPSPMGDRVSFLPIDHKHLPVHQRRCVCGGQLSIGDPDNAKKRLPCALPYGRVFSIRKTGHHLRLQAFTA